MSDHLPVSVLLGTDIPELGDLLKVNSKVACTGVVKEAMVVTRVQKETNQEVEMRGEAGSGANQGKGPASSQVLHRA